MKISISYAHTSDDEHVKKVLKLVDKLAENGLDFMVDYYDFNIADDLYFFMEKLTLSKENDYVLAICNNEYKRKADNYIGGVGYEAKNLRWLASKPTENKVIPVVFERDSEGNAIRPNFLITLGYVDLSNDYDFVSDEFNDLIEFLKGVKRIRPKVNPIPQFQNFNDKTSSQLSYNNNIPFKRKSNLSNRSYKVVLALAKFFERNKLKDLSEIKIPLIQSWSGDGKTTAAIEFAYIFGTQFLSSFWFDFRENINDQLERISHIIEINVPNDLSKNDIREFRISKTIEYFTRNTALLICDNVSNLSDIKKIFPKSGKSRILVVTTNLTPSPGNYYYKIEFPELTDIEAENILFNEIKLRSEDIKWKKKLMMLVGKLSYDLEMANFYIKSLYDISLEEIYKEFEIKSNNWKGLQNQYDFDSIHQSSSSLVLHESIISKLKVHDNIDRMSYELLAVFGCIAFSNEEFKIKDIITILGIEGEERNMLFFEAKKRLIGLGIIIPNEDKFVIHTRMQSYLKTFCITEPVIFRFIDYNIKIGFENVDMQIQLGLWSANKMPSLIKSLLLYAVDTFKSNIINSGQYYISRLINLYNIEDFGSGGTETLSTIRFINELIENQNIKIPEHIQNLLTYLEAKALHKLEKFEEALIKYESITHAEKKLHSVSIIVHIYLYIGHIYRYKKDFEKSKDSYDDAIFHCEEFRKHFRAEVEYLTIKYIVFFYLDCLANETKNLKLKQENQLLMNVTREELLKHSQNDIESFEKNNPHHYPFEIEQTMIRPCTYTPNITMLQARTVKAAP